MNILICNYSSFAMVGTGGSWLFILIEDSKEVYARGEKAYKDLGVGDKCTLVIGNERHRFYADCGL